MALVTRTRRPFWMSLIISFSLMRKGTLRLGVPAYKTEWDFGPPCDQARSLWPALIPCCPFPPSDLVVSFSTSYLCPQLWEEDTLLQELSFTYWQLLVLFWEGLMFITDFKNQGIVTYKNLIACRDVWQTWTCICNMFLKNEMAVVGPQCLTQDRNLFLSHVLGSVGSSPQGHQGPALVGGPTICIP